ncbi:MAG: hypothetical protein ACP5E3_12350, partial [Bacteroidales bacterium]
MVILQTQPTVGAALEIIIMLLGAAIIGVLTTYFFMKSKYDKIIHSLESELESTQKERDRLNVELSNTKQELAAKNEQFEELNKKHDELL